MADPSDSRRNMILRILRGIISFKAAKKTKNSWARTRKQIVKTGFMEYIK